MKIHAKKKAYRARLREEWKNGKIVNAEGKIVERSQIPDNSMRRDFYPQRG